MDRVEYSMWYIKKGEGIENVKKKKEIDENIR